MTENRPYHLRLKAPFAWYDALGSQMFHDFPAGKIVSDIATIKLLESINAPTEKIFEGNFRR
jgi:hypothetical protein